MFEACEYEDSTNCVWNAQEQGNGQGQTFVDIDGSIHYVEDPTVYNDVWTDEGVSFPYQYVWGEVNGEPYMVIVWEGEPTEEVVVPEPEVVELDNTEDYVVDLVLPETVEEVVVETPVIVDHPEELAYTGALETGTGIIVGVVLIIAGYITLKRGLKND